MIHFNWMLIQMGSIQHSITDAKCQMKIYSFIEFLSFICYSTQFTSIYKLLQTNHSRFSVYLLTIHFPHHRMCNIHHHHHCCQNIFTNTQISQFHYRRVNPQSLERMMIPIIWTFGKHNSNQKLRSKQINHWTETQAHIVSGNGN